MKRYHKLKILNDPIYGFITIPNEDIYKIIEHPYFQRLRRVTQMGLSYLVYPGAHHTRFHHALGCLHLMQKAVYVLRSKNVAISDIEEDALYKAILLHDIGHGPFSHALEHSIVQEVSHEQLSIAFMQELNDVFNGGLQLAISIFKGEYHRKFMLDLISSQLDMDRLDYLKRDSFYTGVAEGNINSERLISMLNVVDDQLVVEEKGLYSIEHFLTGRKLMYWQVYLHKTGIGAEHLLQSVFKRAKEMVANGIQIDWPDNLLFFINNHIAVQDFKGEILDRFSQLDDTDVVTALKNGAQSSDFVMSELCKMILNRQLLKIKFLDQPVDEQKLASKMDKLIQAYDLQPQQAQYFVFSGSVSHYAFAKANPIKILSKSGKIKSLSQIADNGTVTALTQKIVKHYYCYPKVQD